MTRRLALSIAIVGVVATGWSVLTAAPGPTRVLRQPTVSADRVAFTYASDVWVVERSGGIARRITSFQGTTSNPKFSPDGKLIAFSADYGGNTDVYVVAAEARAATRQ